MDNRQIDITSRGSKAMEMAANLIWDNAPGGKASHYKVVKLKERVRYYGEPVTGHYTELVEDETGIETLILLWSAEKNAIALPYPLTVDQAIPFIAGWLNNANYGHEPDHDGDNRKGWRFFTDCWGHVAGHHYAIVGVQPTWAMYGK